jgi:hypothetical protein
MFISALFIVMKVKNKNIINNILINIFAIISIFNSIILKKHLIPSKFL